VPELQCDLKAVKTFPMRVLRARIFVSLGGE
jgi:hypothetical protein